MHTDAIWHGASFDERPVTQQQMKQQMKKAQTAVYEQHEQYHQGELLIAAVLFITWKTT